MTHVVIVTDRPSFESAWSPLLTQAGAGVEVVHPELCASSMTHGRPLLVDGGSTAYDEDELLAHASLARALGIPVAVVLPSGLYGEIEDLLDDVCAMRVARREEEIPRLVTGLARAAAAARPRFEYLTVSPRGEALLAVFGDGSASLVNRPAHPDDDGSEVLAITIADDASGAEVELAGGKTFSLAAGALLASRAAPRPEAPREASASSSGQLAAAATQELALSSIDGAKLGARIRELRLAAGLTQAELARRTGIHRPNIARVEAGRHTPSLETLARLAAAIGVPTTSVLSVG